MIIPPVDSRLLIVRNGLVYYNNPSIQTCYPLSGFNFDDISGVSGRVCQLFNGGTYDSLNGGCMYFDGINDYGRISNTSPSNPPPWALHHSNSTGLSICFWIRYNTVVRSLDGGIAYGDQFGNNASGHFQWQFIKHIGGSPSQYYMAFQVAGTGGGYGVNILHTDYTLVANTWLFLSFTYDKTSHNVKVYINGSDMGLTSYTFGTVPPTYASPIYSWTSISGRATSAARYPHLGYLSDIMFYNRELTSDEVLHNYTTTKTRFGL